MEGKYTIVISDKDLFECQKKAWLTIESSVAYQNLPEDMKELVRNNLRDYSKLLQGIMWKQRHIAFTDDIVLATMMDNYNEAIPSADVKHAAIKILARCPSDNGPAPRKKEAPRYFAPKEQVAASFKENFFKAFGQMPKTQTV